MGKSELKQIRLQGGLTQAQLAEVLKLSSQTRISEYEKERREEAQKDFKNRCFSVIEVLVSDIIYSDIEKLRNDIYEIAHIGRGTCNNEHTEWVKNTEKLYKLFKESGLI